ncbi:sialate O-acetylesterase [Planctomycetes bacterium TBK1r]|uniref:Sialate O-acetylesterase domain-containing protein n=1 Tax=Stieleria magnilauensis TaxID=2527963 RepID=A0ABX5XKR5_9BACT|nr:hypothetical protein TBK1r_13660 [Planctomycetes bacterium TBK1r]
MSLLRLAASVLLPLVAFFGAHSHAAETDGKHLFILSGQSNMQGHRPEEAFTPAVKEALGEDNVIVVQDALGGQPIQRWFKATRRWESGSPKTP